MKLHRVVDGPADAPTLVLGGSLGSTLDMWAPQVAALNPALRVVRYDHRGHGGTPASEGPYSVEELAVDVVELLDDLDVEQAHIGGLSLGGMVAMALAIQWPERVRSLSLMCTSARLGPAEAWRERAALVRAEGTSSVAAAVVGRWFTTGYAAAHRSAIERFEDMVAGVDAQGYAACCEAIAAMDLLPHLWRVTAPTLVIAGDDDPATPPDHAAEIASRIERTQLEVLAPAAHLASWERAGDVSRLLLQHITTDTRAR